MKPKRRKARRKANAHMQAHAAIPQTASFRFPALGTAVLALAVLALTAAYLAALYAVAGGKANLHLSIFTNHDQIITWLMYRGAFVEGAYPLDGIRTGVASFLLPDRIGLFALFALGVPPVAANVLLPLIFAAVSIGGWIAVSVHLFGNSTVRIAFVILTHALPFLLIAAGPNDIHALALIVVSHYGTWVCVPWLIFLAMRTLEGSKHPAWAAGAMTILLALVVASDLVIVPWFVGPIAVMLGLFALNHMGSAKRFGPAANVSKPRLLMVAAALACGVPAGILLAKALPFVPSRNAGSFLSADLQGLIGTLAVFGGELAAIVLRNPISSVMWTLFAAIAAWRMWTVLIIQREKSHADACGILGVPPGTAQAVLVLYFPVAAFLSVAAVVLTGNVGTTWAKDNLVHQLRYVIPLFSIPLFVGWSLLPWENGRLQKWAGRLSLAAAACIAMLAGGMVLASKFPLSKFNIYSAPFHECFATAALRLGWKGGIGSSSYTGLIANPAAGIERYVPVGVLRSQQEGESVLYLDWNIENRHWFDGDFQYVIVNGYNGRLVAETPLDENSHTCPLSDFSECLPARHAALILDERAVQGAFGPPQEIVECYGMGFYHYDPPIRLDYARVANPDLTRVGNVF